MHLQGAKLAQNMCPVASRNTGSLMPGDLDLRNANTVTHSEQLLVYALLLLGRVTAWVPGAWHQGDIPMEPITLQTSVLQALCWAGHHWPMHLSRVRRVSSSWQSWMSIWMPQLWDPVSHSDDVESLGHGHPWEAQSQGHGHLKQC